MDCSHCGREYPYYYDKCPYCGAVNTDPNKPQQYRSADNDYQQNYNSQQYDLGYRQPGYSRYDRGEEPVSIGSWIAVWLLTCIPIVGFVMLIVWACGGTSKKSLKNWARAQFIILLILILIGVIAAVVMYAMGFDISKSFNVRYY